MKLHMFRTVRLSIIRNLFTVHSATVYVVQVCRQLSSRTVPSWSCSKADCKPVWHIPLLSVQWINSWWWTDKVSETRRVSWQNKCVKLVHLVGFIIKKILPWLRLYSSLTCRCFGVIAMPLHLASFLSVRHWGGRCACWSLSFGQKMESVTFFIH